MTRKSQRGPWQRKPRECWTLRRYITGGGEYQYHTTFPSRAEAVDFGASYSDEACFIITSDVVPDRIEVIPWQVIDDP